MRREEVYAALRDPLMLNVMLGSFSLAHLYDDARAHRCWLGQFVVLAAVGLGIILAFPPGNRPALDLGVTHDGGNVRRWMSYAVFGAAFAFMLYALFMDIINSDHAIKTYCDWVKELL